MRNKWQTIYIKITYKNIRLKLKIGIGQEEKYIYFNKKKYFYIYKETWKRKINFGNLKMKNVKY